VDLNKEMLIAPKSASPAPISLEFDQAVEENCDWRRRRAGPQLDIYKLRDRKDLLKLVDWARGHDYYLCTLFGVDERNMGESQMAIYYLFSGGSPRRLVGVKFLLGYDLGTLSYPSIRKWYPYAAPLEQETILIGAHAEVPLSGSPSQGEVLTRFPYPDSLQPMQYDHHLSWIRDHLDPTYQPAVNYLNSLWQGKTVSVGEIHAQIIGGGLFLFKVDGEVIEDLRFVLGAQHRGVEKLFETHYDLLNGWKLAERVEANTSFAHSLAYCRAVEALADVQPSSHAETWRALFLEMERLYNHIGNVAALFHDIAIDTLANRLLVLQEALYRLNERLTGNFLLRDINRPGGVDFSHAFPRALYPNPQDITLLRVNILKIADNFLRLCDAGMNNRGSRRRFLRTGILSAEQAAGACGLAARASGVTTRDFRCMHPWGAYAQDPDLRKELNKRMDFDKQKDYTFKMYPEMLNGDAFSRLCLRIAEVESSARMIDHLATRLPQKPLPTDLMNASVAEALWDKTTYHSFGVGFSESWCGDIFYWVLKGPNLGIARCSLRDPAVYNWPAMGDAVIRNERIGNENILPDFPIINKSFNNSYPGFAK
jgi:Ni,Fe-hydrogenase III large subunit